MSYKFKTGEPFDEALHRLIADQIEHAGKWLDPVADVHKGAHEARKTMKRLRALLALFRDAIPDGDYRELNTCFRDVARALAGTREIQALLDSLDLLDKRSPTGRPTGVSTRLRARIEAQRDAASTAPQALAARNASLNHELSRAAKHAAQIGVARADFGAIEPGLTHAYRAARRSQTVAYQDNTSESFHEWRKALQRHWRHLQLLSPAWPEALRARAQMTRSIAETVGWDHDLAMLDAYLESQASGLGTAAQVRAFRRLCLLQQAELRSRIAGDGRLLFAESASGFAERVERYWRIAGETGLKPASKRVLATAEQA